MVLPSLRQIQYLMALHKERNFNRAAERCHVSQSTLSVAISNLEEFLGAQLVERDNRKLFFTAIGEAVVERGHVIIEQTQGLVSMVKQYEDIMSGELTLGSIPSIVPFVLPKFVRQCRVQFPNLQLMLREDTTDQLVLQLEEGDIELALLALPVELPSFHIMTLYSEKFRLVIHKDNQDLIDGIQHFDELPKHSLFLLENEHCLRGHALSVCHLTNTDVVNPFAASSLITLVTMLEDGVGCSILPQMAIDAGLLKGTSLIDCPMPFDETGRDIGLVWRKTTYRSPCFRKLGEFFKTIV